MMNTQNQTTNLKSLFRAESIKPEMKGTKIALITFLNS